MVGVYALIVGLAIAFDVFSGLAAAVKNRELNSRKMKDGLWNKIALIMVFVFGCFLYYIQQWISVFDKFTIPTVESFAIYIVAMELLSVFENIGKLNDDLVNSSFFKFLEQLRRK